MVKKELLNNTEQNQNWLDKPGQGWTVKKKLDMKKFEI